MSARCLADYRWQCEWKAWIRDEARTRVPLWLADAAQRSEPPEPPRNHPQQQQPPRRPDARRPARLRKIALAATHRLPVEQPRDTSSLLTSAVRHFCQQHGYPPQTIALNPCRHRATGDYVPVACEDLGCFTVTVHCDPGVPVDAARVAGQRYAWSERVEALYL